MPVSITFTTSLSRLFPVALEIAAQAAEFTEEPVGKIKRYRATFGRTPEQAELAVALIQHLDSIKGVLVHAGGRLVVNQDAVIATLGCFISAQAGGGVATYCCQTIEIADKPKHLKSGIEHVDLDNSGPSMYRFPCAKLLRSGFLADVAAESLVTKIQAEAAREHCDWCPNFKPKEFKRL